MPIFFSVYSCCFNLGLMQKYEDLDITEEMELVFTRIKNIRGGRPKRTIWNYRKFMETHCGHGGCFIQIQNPDDNLCLARAIQVAIYRLEHILDPGSKEKEQLWNQIRRGDRTHHHFQKQKAKELMREVGLGNHYGKYPI